MNQKQRAKLRTERRESQRNRHLLKQQEMAEAQELEEAEEIPMEAETETPETLEKDYGEAAMMNPGPTSWEEMDSLKMAREQAEHVRHATWDTQDLVYNILGHPGMGPKEKADAMKKVADGFGARVSEMV